MANIIQPVNTKDRPYGWVAITGASSGLGAALARQIAPQSRGVIVIGRSKDKLLALEKEITAASPKTKVVPIICDLTRHQHRRKLIEDLSARRINTLILNAGSGVFKKFQEAPMLSHLETVELNITANLDLTYHLLPTMGANPRLQVITSHSSGMRIPNFSVYVPAKTFLTHWAQTLALEHMGSPLKISIICAGAMSTEFGPRSGVPKQVSKIASPGEIAAKCIPLLDRPGTHYLTFYDKLIAALNRFLPRFFIDFLVLRIQTRYLK